MALKIIFMGTPEFAVPILKKIYDSEHTIKEVYTKEPKKKNGRAFFSRRHLATGPYMPSGAM